MSWRNTKKLGRQFGRAFVNCAAHHSGVIVATDINGDCWEIDRRTGVCLPDNEFGRTTTAALIREDDGTREDAWAVEVRRRVAELTATASVV